MVIDSAVFYTNDIDKVVTFYVDILGIKLEYRREDRYVSFIFDNDVRLGIKKSVQEREKPGAQTVFIGISDIKSLYEKYQALNLEFHKPLSYMEGFGHSFAIYDPDRNKIEFVQREVSVKS